MNDAEIFSSIHAMPPVDTKLVAGRWHRDRAAVEGFLIEARVFLKNKIVPYNDNKRFLLLGRARSGTTLLTRLLNDHSHIHCDGEILKYNMLSPRRHFERLAGKSASSVYGAKILSYQMVQVHRMYNPKKFLDYLVAQGVHLIHLERNTFLQTLSLAVAQRRRQYHVHKGAEALNQKIYFEPQDFLRRLLWSEALLSYEKAALLGLPHMRVLHERDLVDRVSQQDTLDRICTLLEVPAEPMNSPIKKVLPNAPEDIIENYGEIHEAIEKSGWGHLISDGRQRAERR